VLLRVTGRAPGLTTRRRYFGRRRLEEVLLEVKRLQVQVLELQEQLRSRADR
jgi:hypothetical protein